MVAAKLDNSRVHDCDQVSSKSDGGVASILAIGADFKMYLLRQFCSNRVDFLQYTEDIDAKKMMEQNFEIRIMSFLGIF